MGLDSTPPHPSRVGPPSLLSFFPSHRRPSTMSASTSFDASISGSAAAADVSTPPPSSPSSSTDAAAAAAARREARKARILGKGSDRLAKLTKQARGDEAEMLYPSTPPPAAAAAGASPAQSKSALTTTTAATGEEDPEEIDISNQARMDDEMQRAMQMFQQRQQQGQTQSQQGQGSPMPQDPFAQMMAALTGGGGAMGGGPPGQDGMNGGGMPDLSQLFAAMQQQQPGAGGNGAGVPPGFPGAPATKVSPASWLSTRLFSLLHTLVFLALGYFAIASALGGGSSAPVSIETDELNLDDTAVLGTGHNEASQRLQSWASLAYYRPSTAASGLSSGLQSRHFDIDGAWLGVKGPLVSIERCTHVRHSLWSYDRADHQPPILHHTAPLPPLPPHRGSPSISPLPLLLSPFVTPSSAAANGRRRLPSLDAPAVPPSPNPLRRRHGEALAELAGNVRRRYCCAGVRAGLWDHLVRRAGQGLSEQGWRDVRAGRRVIQ